MTQTLGEFIVQVWPGIPPITIPDHPKTEAAALQFIRAGNKVMYRRAGETIATHDEESSQPAAKPALAEGEKKMKRGGASLW